MTSTTAALLASLLVFTTTLALTRRRSHALHRLRTRPTGGQERAHPPGVIERRRLLSIGGTDLARTSGRRLAVLGALVALSIGIASSLGPSLLFSTATIAAISAIVRWQRNRQRRSRAEAARRAQIIEACDVLAADLSAGRPPQDALEGASASCADLRVAAAAAKLGGDVAGALTLAAESPGAEGLRALGAAWRVAEESGAAFATIVERLADSLRADEAIRRQIAANLAGTRSTAHLLAGLPLFGTALGYAIGANPLNFLTTTPVGWLCLTAGLALTTIGLLWTDRLANL